MSYASAQVQQDLSRTTPLMQSAFAAVASLKPLVTSVLHGRHAENSAHYAGRAVDVGAFGGTDVGWNAPTWNAIVSAIASHRFEAIGTLAQIVSNPQLQAFAQQNGVRLFEDDQATGASGPHIHFQVAPSG